MRQQNYQPYAKSMNPTRNYSTLIYGHMLSNVKCIRINLSEIKRFSCPPDAQRTMYFFAPKNKAEQKVATLDKKGMPL